MGRQSCCGRASAKIVPQVRAGLVVRSLNGFAMLDVEVETRVGVEPTEKMIRAQLELMVQDEIFRTSKRSVAFLRYVVEQTIQGSADLLKERTIGVEVFGRKPSYDTNLDHVVRTAATELRKRLAIYYGDERHRSELHVGLIPGSYIPKFAFAHHSNGSSDGGVPVATQVTSMPVHAPEPGALAEMHVPAAAPVRHSAFQYWIWAAAVVLLIGSSLFGYAWLHRPNAQDWFWKPILDSPGPVLIAVGDVPDGPPVASSTDSPDGSTPILRSATSQTVPFSDAVTIAEVVGVLESKGKRVVIRRENSRSFSDLREGPLVLVGAFNNEWSLRLTHQLRYSLALDAEKHLIYIKDAKNPSSRSWSWGTNQPKDGASGPGKGPVQDYALISRIRNSDTGHIVVVIGGLYRYGTQSAGEFLTDTQLMQGVAKTADMDPAHQNLQIVLGTTVTDETPGPPRVLAVSAQ